MLTNNIFRVKYTYISEKKIFKTYKAQTHRKDYLTFKIKKFMTAIASLLSG